MKETAHEIIESFCIESLGGCDFCEMLAGDASTRMYYRVQYAGSTYIICHDPSLVGHNADEYPFLQVQKLFSRNAIPVPEVYRYDISRGLILQEDGGDFLLEDYVQEAPGEVVNAVYEKLLETIIAIQLIVGDGSIPFSLVFDEEKLMFEFSFFLEHAFNDYFGVDNANVKKELNSFFHNISLKLQRKDLFVLCHRDYHARNILMRDDGYLVIDFQDARMGLPLYDVVSLLRDSYASLNEDALSHLKMYYYNKSSERGVHSMSKDEFEYLFNLSAFQRNVKALGTFGYQIVKRGKGIYRQYIDRTLGYLEIYANCEQEIAKPAHVILDCIRSRT